MGARSTKNTASNNKSDGHLLSYFRNTFISGGGAKIFASQIFNISTTGIATVTSGSAYKYAVWTGPGSFTINSIQINFSPIPAGNIDYLLVGGGGGGGRYSPYTDGTAGSPSTALGLTAYGGGFGAAYASAGGYGGSGGGAGGNSGASGGGLGNRVTGPAPAVPASIPAPLTPQGTDGGNAPAVYGAGGGGGAGGVGGNGPFNNTWGIGGIGKVAFNGDSEAPLSYGTSGPTPGRWFAAGGSGSGGNPAGGTGAQPIGGGGSGDGVMSRNAVSSTGSGGGTFTAPTGGGSGGGGAGGFLSGSMSVATGPYPISIGAGGPGGGNGAGGIFILRVPVVSTVS